MKFYQISSIIISCFVSIIAFNEISFYLFLMKFFHLFVYGIAFHNIFMKYNFIFNKPPLFIAVEKENIEIIQMLLNHGNLDGNLKAIFIIYSFILFISIIIHHISIIILCYKIQLDNI